MAFHRLLLLLLIVPYCARCEATHPAAAGDDQFPRNCEEDKLKRFIRQWRQEPKEKGPTPRAIVRRVGSGPSSEPRELLYSCGDQFEIELQVPHYLDDGKTIDSLLLHASSPGPAETNGRFHIQSSYGWWLMNCQMATESVLIAVRSGNLSNTLRVLWNAPCNVTTRGIVEFTYIAMDSATHIYKPATNHRLFHTNAYHHRGAMKRVAGSEQDFCTLDSPNLKFGSCRDHGMHNCCMSPMIMDCQVPFGGETCYCDPGCFTFGDCCADINEIKCSCDASLPKIDFITSPTSENSKELSVFPETQVTLSCEVDGVPIPSVWWLRDGNAIETGPNLNVTYEDMDPGSPTVARTSLNIDRMSPEYTGVYTCTASNNAGTTSKDRILSLCDTTVSHERLNVSEGNNVQLSCKCVPPGSQTVWKHQSLGGKNRTISSGSNMKVLSISDITYQDSGTYSCIVTAGKFSSGILHEVMVQVSPQVNLVGDYNVSESTQLQLRCSATGSPLPDINWFMITHDDRVVTSLSSRSSLRLTTEATVNASASLDYPPAVINFLTLDRLHTTDRGEYVCRAENRLDQRIVGMKSLDVTVSVKDECKETGGPLCLNGGECLDSYNAFYCQCNGSYGGHRCGEALEGPLRPPEIVRQPHSVQALLHQPVNLTCIADGNPAPRYRWWRDGEVMEGLALPFLYIHEARPSDRAFYKCEASNSEGSEVSQEAHLSIPGVYQHAVSVELSGGYSINNFTEMVAVELVGKNLTTTVRVYSVQPAKSHQNFTLLITVIAESQDKDGLAELIRNELLQLIMIADIDIKRYDGCITETGVPIFPGSEKFRYSWVESELVEVANDSCPCQRFLAEADPVAGRVTRQCGGTYTNGAQWDDTGFGDCGLSKLALQLCEEGLSDTNEEIAQEIARMMEDTKQLDASAITVAATIIAENLTTAAIEEPPIRANYLTILDNLMVAPATEILLSQQKTRSSSKLLESMGTFSDLVPLSNTTEGRDTYTRKVFAIQVHDVDPSLFSGQAFSVDLGTVREAMNGTDQEIGEQYLLSTMEALANATASIQVTPSILGRSSNKRHLVEQERISYDVFLTDSLFQTNNDRYVTASIIMGTRVRLQTDEGRTEAKITTTFQTEEAPPDDSVESVCAHYNPHGDNGFGSWSSSSCKVTKRSTNQVECDCSQPTHFGLLFDLSPGETLSEGALSLEIITYVGTGLSLVCLLLVIITYSASKKLRSTQHGKLLINLCLALMGLYIVFLIAGQVTSISALCGIVAGLLQYFVLVFFGWTAAEAVNLYMKLVIVLGKGAKHYVLKAALIVWTVPLVVVGISAGAGHDYYVNPFFCRATEWPFWFGLILPFIVIYVFDWVVFITILVSLLKKAKYRKEVKTSPSSTASEVKRHLLIAVGLATIFGLGWGFGLAATSSSTKEVTFAFQLIFSIFVGFQGVLIFILHGVRSPEVRRTWQFWRSSSVSRAGASGSGSYRGSSMRARATNSLLETQQGTLKFTVDPCSSKQNGLRSPNMVGASFDSVDELDCKSPLEELPGSGSPEAAVSPPLLGRHSPLDTVTEGGQTQSEESTNVEAFGSFDSPEAHSGPDVSVRTIVDGPDRGTAQEIEYRSTSSTGITEDPLSTDMLMDGATEGHTEEDQVRAMRAAAARLKRVSGELSEHVQALLRMEEEAEEGRDCAGADPRTDSTEVQRDPSNQTKNLPSPLHPTSPSGVSIERVDSGILPSPEFVRLEEDGASPLDYLDGIEFTISNPMVNEARKISQHMHQISEFTQDRGKLQTKQDLIAAAKDIVTSVEEIIGYARLICDNCREDKGSSRHTLQETVEALSTRSNILNMNASRYAKDVAATDVNVLVRNTQEIMQFVIQAVEAAESAILKGMQSPSPTGAEESEARDFAHEWKNDLYNLRRKVSITAPEGARGLRKTKGSTLAGYIQDLHSQQSFV